jgi:WD40-like Beta Propeller Repeat
MRFTGARVAGVCAVAGVLCISGLAAHGGGAAGLEDAPTPRLFADGVISTVDDEVNGSFSADGQEYYFGKLNQYTNFPNVGILCVSHLRDGKWSEPEVLPFSGQHLDFAPRMSPDGTTMYFGSARPAPEKTARVMRIWSVKRNASGWDTPQPLPAPVNVENHWDWAPSVTKEGTIYFTSDRSDDRHPHIYRSRLVNGVYAEPEKLGPGVNSEFSETDAFVSADERVLVFASIGDELPLAADRPETVKGGGVRYPRADLYVSVRGDGGSGDWSPAKHLEHDINTFADESSPSISPDGKFLFFSSERSPFSVPTAHPMSHAEFESALHSTLNGHGNIFYINIDALGVAVPKESK